MPYDVDIVGLTHCITGYINFCVDNVISARTVTCFLNSKPWIARDFLNVKRELRIKIKESKDTYRRKMEARLQGNSTREVC